MKKEWQLLIGNTIRVVEAKNKKLIGMKGRVIDETKNLIVIETEKGIKKLIKKQIKFKIENGKEKNERRK